MGINAGSGGVKSAGRTLPRKAGRLRNQGYILAYIFRRDKGGKHPAWIGFHFNAVVSRTQRFTWSELVSSSRKRRGDTPTEVTIRGKTNMNENEAAEAEAIKLLDTYLDAVNGKDDEAGEATFHFPHIRISEEKVTIWQAPGEGSLDRFRKFAAEDGWSHSTWDSRRVLHHSNRKIHLEVQFTRYRADESVIGQYRSIYILTHHDGRWGIQARSSFAP